MPLSLSYDAVCFDLFGTLLGESGSAYAGASEALSVLPPRRWAIVTSASGRLARALLTQAHLPVPSVLVSAESVARSKPAPDGYLLAAQLLGVAPDRVLVVEDSPQGIRAGRDAGMDVLGVVRGRGMNVAAEALYLAERLADVRWNVGEHGEIGVTL
jgi:sugar-phosphatase